VLIVKKFEFPKSKMADAAILKTVKSPYRSNRLTSFDEIWHGDAHWPPTGDTPLKFPIFQKPRWRTAANLKTVKSPYLRNRLTDFDEIGN